MRRLPGLVLLSLLAAACASTARAPIGDLHTTIAARLTTFAGRVGFYVRDLATGDEVAIDADATFPTASLIKVPILAALLERVDRGELDYHASLVYERSRLYPGEDLLGSFADGSRIELAKVVMLMITTSDNTAALWCQELAGTGTAINEFLVREGFVTTRVNSRTPGREDAKARWGWGQTTPREMAELVARIADGSLVSPAASEEMQRCLSRVYWDGEALSAIPPSVQTASKQGAIDRSRSEVVFVFAPHGAYVLCLITDDQKDTSWRHDNAGFELLRDVSAACWRHFEPGAPYEPPPGMQRFH